MRGLASTMAAALIGLVAAQAGACGADSDCLIGDRSYRILMPEGSARGAILFVHGYRGNAGNEMRNPALTGLARKLGVAFVAAQAAGPEWQVPGVPSDDAQPGIDEPAYFDAVAADLAAQFGIERAQTVVAGFSSGAMMVWHLACQRGDVYAGYVPMSGTFWDPIPQACPGGPVNLIHYHGAQDPVVPLAGRQIKDGHQGDVSVAFDMMTRVGGYRPVAAEPEAGLDCTRRMDDAGHRLELCLFEGKHQFRAGNIRRAWEAFQGQ